MQGPETLQAPAILAEDAAWRSCGSPTATVTAAVLTSQVSVCNAFGMPAVHSQRTGLVGMLRHLRLDSHSCD